MAGAFLISKDVGVSMSTLGFDFIAESTRKEIAGADWAFVSDVYRAYDHEGMTFLYLIDATPLCFSIFYAATIAAMRATESKSPNFPKALWEELRQKLEEDPRYVA